MLETAEGNADDGPAEAARSSSASANGEPAVWVKVPPQNMLFTGRNKLLEHLHEQLTAHTTAAVLSPSQRRDNGAARALQGIPGVGKTQLATEYAHRYKSHYDLVLWVAADQAPLVRGSIAALAGHLGLPSDLSASVEDTANAVIDRLRRGKPIARWLLIFDNADQPDEIRQFLLTDGPGHTIITSRNPAWRNQVKTLTVDVFTRGECREFLRQQLPGIPAADLDSLAEALGRLPLALDQAAAHQAGSGMSVREYLKALDSQAALLLAEGKPTDYPFSATTTVHTSITTLAKENPAAVELLRCCAFFGPGPIPRDVLSEGRDVVTTSLKGLLGDFLSFNRAIGDLGRYALATVDPRSRTLGVHRVTQAIVRDSLTSDQRDQFRQDVHQLLAAATPTDSDNPLSWQRYQELLGHYGPAGVVNSRDPRVRLLVRGVVRYYYMLGNFGAAAAMADHALDVWSKDPDARPEDLLAIKRHRADILRASGRYEEAYQLNARTIEEATARLGADDDQTLRVTNSHGADLRAAGEFSAAFELDSQTVLRSQKAFTAPDRRILRAQNNLAVDMVLLGRYDEAAELHHEVYRQGRSVYGRDNHPSVLISRMNYACAVRLAGRYADACLMAEDTYAACGEALGAGHPVLLFAATDLAIALRMELGGADALGRVAGLLRDHRLLRGDQNLDTIAAMIAQANTLRDAGDLGSAVGLVRSALATYEAVLRPDHPYTLGCRGTLAALLRLTGDLDGAKEADEAALRRLAATLGPDHPYAMACELGLASDLAGLGDVQGAVTRGEDALARMRSVLRAGHPYTCSAAANLAADLSALGRSEESGALRAEALATMESALGPDHPRLAAARGGQRLEFDFDPPPN